MEDVKEVAEEVAQKLLDSLTGSNGKCMSF